MHLFIVNMVILSVWIATKFKFPLVQHVAESKEKWAFILYLLQVAKKIYTTSFSAALFARQWNAIVLIFPHMTSLLCLICLRMWAWGMAEVAGHLISWFNISKMGCSSANLRRGFVMTTQSWWSFLWEISNKAQSLPFLPSVARLIWT